jgi:stage II sporulation protein M
LRAAWGTFVAAYGGLARGRGLLQWYRREIPATLRRLAGPVLVVTGALAVAVLLGNYYASVFQLHISFTQMQTLKSSFGERLAQFGLVSPMGAGWVFFTNLRALGLASLLGTFSLGVLGMVLLMIPLSLTGYFAGQLALAGISPWLFFAAFILPHGIFEIPAAILEGAAMLRLGACVLAPPPGKTLGEGWLMALADWVKLSVAVVVPLLAAAALMEALVTPRIIQMVFGG